VAPGIVVLALYIKNLVLFGTFTTSSWFGMNLMSEVTFFMPPDAAFAAEWNAVTVLCVKPFSSAGLSTVCSGVTAAASPSR
jgi:hypothetical protein